jgi:hypothetical protein
MAEDRGIESFTHLETSPFIFIEDVQETNPTGLEILRTPYSEDYIRKVLEPVYLGNKFKLFTSFTGNRFDRVPMERVELSITEWLPTSLDHQSLETPPPDVPLPLDIPRLLNLPDYAEKRIRDMATSLGGDVEENIRIFLENNSYTFYSSDKSEELTIFCPLLAIENSRQKIKFLRLDRRTGKFYPYIYSVIFGIDVDYWYHCMLLSEEFQQGIRFSIRFEKDPEVKHLYYTGYSLYTEGFLRTVELDRKNPNDCGTITQFLCGLILQPDLVRYHCLFKQLRRGDDNDFVTELATLNPIETSEFIENRIVNRSPANEIHQLHIYYTEKDMSGLEIMNINGSTIYHDNKKLYCFTANSSIDNLTLFLDSLGCNQPNCLFYLCLFRENKVGHAAILHYDGEYKIYDAQLKRNSSFSKIFERFDTIVLYIILTDIPEKRYLLVPEFPIVYDYDCNSYNYTGDIYPLVRSGVDLFRKSRGHLHITGDLGKLLQIVDNPITTTSLDEKGIPDILENFYNSSLLLLFQPTPITSFDKLYKTGALLERATQNLNSFIGLKTVRGFVNRFLRQEEPLILQLMKPSFFRRRYTEKELYDFLYTRPLYASIMKELLDLYPEMTSYFSKEIAAYLSRQSKPVLRLVPLYLKVIELAKASGTKEYLVRYLSRLRDKSRAYLTTMAQKMQVDGAAPFEELARQIYYSLEQFFSYFELQKKSVRDKAKVNVAVDSAKEIVLNSHIDPEDVNEFIVERQTAQWEEYLKELDGEKPDEREKGQILNPVTVTQEMIDGVQSSFMKKNTERRVGHYAIAVKKSFIRDYIDEMIENETDRVLSIPLSQWPQLARENVDEEAERLLRVSFVTDEDNANAMNAFVSLMNLVVIQSPSFTDKYLGKR